MSVSRVRHRGHKPRDIDHGPSSGQGRGGGPGGHAEVARLSAYAPSKLVAVGERLTGGAGAIERRQATEAQREAWRRDADSPPARPSIEDIPTAVAWRPEPGSIAQTRAAQMHASRMRGGERNRQLVTAARVVAAVTGPTVTARTIEEEPVMATEPPPPVTDPEPSVDPFATALWAVRDAADEAAEAWSLRVEAERRWQGAEAALRACVEGLAQPIRPDILAAFKILQTPPARPNGATIIPETIPDEPADDAPEVVTRKADGGPGTIPPYQRRMLDALVSAGGDVPTAAAAIGIKATSLTGTMGRLRKIGGLTDAERAVVARKR